MVLLTEDSLDYFYRYYCHDFGITENVVFYGYSSQSVQNTLFMKTVKKYDTKYHVSSTCRPNENPMKVTIRELRKRWYLIMHKNKVLEQL